MGQRGQLEGNGHPPVKFKQGPSFPRRPPRPPSGNQSSRTSPWQPHSSQVIFINEGTPIAGEDKRVAECRGGSADDAQCPHVPILAPSTGTHLHIPIAASQILPQPRCSHPVPTTVPAPSAPSHPPLWMTPMVAVAGTRGGPFPAVMVAQCQPWWSRGGC